MNFNALLRQNFFETAPGILNNLPFHLSCRLNAWNQDVAPIFRMKAGLRKMLFILRILLWGDCKVKKHSARWSLVSARCFGLTSPCGKWKASCGEQTSRCFLVAARWSALTSSCGGLPQLAGTPLHLAERKLHAAFPSPHLAFWSPQREVASLHLAESRRFANFYPWSLAF